MNRLPIALLLLAAAIIALAFVPASHPWLQYDRTALHDGQYWRLLSAHLIHLSLNHALLNLAALAIIALLLQRALSQLDWLFALGGSALLIGLGLYILQPNVSWYMGLSGCLHGVLVYGALQLLATRPLPALICLALVASKLAAEVLSGADPALEALIEGPVLIVAHQLGAAAGLIMFMGRVGFMRLRAYFQS